jgi:O-acetyl-ADP-ribose deacetylase (regulator of RNase III)
MYISQADVIVNSTQPSLKLDAGAVSATILAAAGQALQEECNKKYPKGIDNGDVAVTKGHKLSCQEVFHVTLSSWSLKAKQVYKYITKLIRYLLYVMGFIKVCNLNKVQLYFTYLTHCAVWLSGKIPAE